MMIQVRRQEEMTQLQWEEKWNEIKIQTLVVMQDLRAAMNRKDYSKDFPKCWGAVSTAMEMQLKLERIVAGSEAETGWKMNPLPVIEKLIQAIVEIDEPELQAMPEELTILERKMETMISVP
jgi:hypothetical protein